MAMALALWTGQRQGDLLRLTWSAYDGEVIRLRQSKGDVEVTVPVASPLSWRSTACASAARSSSSTRMACRGRRMAFG